MTWSIVVAVVAVSAWLASSVQDARDQGGFRWRVSERAPVAAAPAVRADATHRATVAAVTGANAGHARPAAVLAKP